jgi:hypothetical protein
VSAETAAQVGKKNLFFPTCLFRHADAIVTDWSAARFPRRRFRQPGELVRGPLAWPWCGAKEDRCRMFMGRPLQLWASRVSWAKRMEHRITAQLAVQTEARFFFPKVAKY